MNSEDMLFKVGDLIELVDSRYTKQGWMIRNKPYEIKEIYWEGNVQRVIIISEFGEEISSRAGRFKLYIPPPALLEKDIDKDDLKDITYL